MTAGGRWEPDKKGFTGTQSTLIGSWTIIAQESSTWKDSMRQPLQQNWRAVVRWDTLRCGLNSMLSNDNKAVTKVSGGQGWNGVLGTEPVESYHMNITCLGPNGTLMVGLAPQSRFQIDTINPNQQHYYI